jgi:hAT family C-terminal dimerisation region
MAFWHYNSPPQQANRTEFPTLFTIVMDYLPIQATFILCEHVFSSAKDTDTTKRNQISPVLVEALQMLKYLTSWLGGEHWMLQ